MNTKADKEEQHVLELLDAVGQRSDVSQRHLARQMGVALGLANSYLKRCIRKGLIKISDAPANRYLYYLTPKGFAEKSRLTAKYLTVSFAFYRQAADSCQRVFAACEANGERRVLLAGVSDLAEIALLRALERDIDVVGVHDAATSATTFLGRPVWRGLPDGTSFDICLLTDLKMPRETHTRLVDALGEERVKVPDILRL